MNKLLRLAPLGVFALADPAAAEPAPAKLTWVTHWEACEEHPVVFEGVQFRHAGDPDPARGADMLRAGEGALRFTSDLTLWGGAHEEYNLRFLKPANITDFRGLVAYLKALPPAQRIHVRIRFQRDSDGRSDDLSPSSFKEFSGAGCK